MRFAGRGSQFNKRFFQGISDARIDWHASDRRRLLADDPVANCHCAARLHGDPLQGVLCLFVPLYVYRYAQKHAVGRVLIRAWYAGLAALAAGTVLLS
ncbi:hypothetical protein [Ralstonia solanacearum]|uniref:hypothetical protein n=1 Tax=Ralstonia solanacearum TaxID=305 RepID=UPI001E4E8251|nr:hypothetical protein [Ralstonia solanacearum]MDC6177830.1 hypothetical protein [Ralstonia solanacearum]